MVSNPGSLLEFNYGLCALFNICHTLQTINSLTSGNPCYFLWCILKALFVIGIWLALKYYRMHREILVQKYL